MHSFRTLHCFEFPKHGILVFWNPGFLILIKYLLFYQETNNINGKLPVLESLMLFSMVDWRKFIHFDSQPLREIKHKGDLVYHSMSHTSYLYPPETSMFYIVFFGFFENPARSTYLRVRYVVNCIFTIVMKCTFTVS